MTEPLSLFPWKPLNRADIEQGGHTYYPACDKRTVDVENALIVDVQENAWRQHLLADAFEHSAYKDHVYLPARRQDPVIDDYLRIPRATAVSFAATFDGYARELEDVAQSEDGCALVARSLVADVSLHGPHHARSQATLPCRLAFAGNLDNFGGELAELTPVFAAGEPRPTLEAFVNTLCGAFYYHNSDWADDGQETDSIRFYKEALAWCLRHLHGPPTADPTRHALLQAEVEDSLGWLTPADDTYLIGVQGQTVSLHVMPSHRPSGP